MKGKELNKCGEIYIQKNPQLKMKIVDGSSLVVAIVLNTIPEHTTQVLLCGTLSKVSYAIASALCQRGVKVCNSVIFHNSHDQNLSSLCSP